MTIKIAKAKIVPVVGRVLAMCGSCPQCGDWC
jgi:Mb-OB3b family methanobactin precursor